MSYHGKLHFLEVAGESRKNGVSTTFGKSIDKIKRAARSWRRLLSLVRWELRKKGTLSTSLCEELKYNLEGEVSGQVCIIYRQSPVYFTNWQRNGNPKDNTTPLVSGKFYRINCNNILLLGKKTIRN